MTLSNLFESRFYSKRYNGPCPDRLPYVEKIIEKHEITRIKTLNRIQEIDRIINGKRHK
jgi:hypothetical protein